jgi:uncharacterized membrane protein YgcG
VGRRLTRLAVTLVAFALAAVPLLVALQLGLQHRRLPGDVGRGSGVVVVLVLVYLVWLPAILVGWVWVLDRLGVHYAYTERRPRSTRHETRRKWAGVRFLGARPTFGEGPGPRRRGKGRGKGDGGPEGRGGTPPYGGSSGAGGSEAGGER